MEYLFSLKALEAIIETQGIGINCLLFGRKLDWLFLGVFKEKEIKVTMLFPLITMETDIC